MSAVSGEHRKIMAVDPGTARCGIAVSDPTGTMASPREPLKVGDGRGLPRRIAELAAKLDVGLILVGHPVSMDGTSGPRARAAKRLADSIRKASNARVELCDERLTSVEAEALLREAGYSGRKLRGRVDSAAAAVMLQWWLDSHEHDEVAS